MRGKNMVINTKYYINQNQTEEISMPDAILSWHNQVYLPVINTIKKQKMMKKFKGRTTSDMYVWIIKYWDDLKGLEQTVFRHY